MISANLTNPLIFISQFFVYLSIVTFSRLSCFITHKSLNSVIFIFVLPTKIDRKSTSFPFIWLMFCLQSQPTVFFFTIYQNPELFSFWPEEIEVKATMMRTDFFPERGKVGFELLEHHQIDQNIQKENGKIAILSTRFSAEGARNAMAWEMGNW